MRAQVDSLWDKLWSGGLSNPLDAIEQLSFLLFLKRLDEREQDNERDAKRGGTRYTPLFTDPTLRWSYWTQLPAEDALKHVKEKVFPFIRTLGGTAGSFADQMENAEFKINKPSLLIEACKAIDAMQISNQNQDVQGDLYEYLLSRLNTAGTNGQFRTPRHIIRMMVRMADPQPGERICDPAAGTGGFLVASYQHILERNTREDVLTYDAEGFPHYLTGDKLTPDQHDFLQTNALTGYDNDSGMTMLRVGNMNLMLHGIESPRFRYADTLSKSFSDADSYDVVLANPPFKGAIDAADVNPSLPARIKKTEILFLHLFVRLLDSGGRAAVIVPDGVLFGSTNAHIAIRRKLIEENGLQAVVAMPAGVFRPYAGVSTAALFFSKLGATERIWFYDMEHDGFSLDDKRKKVEDNDIPDILQCWSQRDEPLFLQARAHRIAELRRDLSPLKETRIARQSAVHVLRFEEVTADVNGRPAARLARQRADEQLAEVGAQIGPLQRELDQLERQFWVTKEQVKQNRYDLSPTTYRQFDRDATYHEPPSATLQRLQIVNDVARRDVETLLRLLGDQ